MGIRGSSSWYAKYKYIVLLFNSNYGLGSVAAILQSRIGNVPKNSWFSYLQSYGGKGFARRAIFRGGVYLTLAILIAVAGKALYDSGIGQMYIEPLAEKVWHQMETKLDRRGEVGSGAPGSVATEIRAQ